MTTTPLPARTETNQHPIDHVARGVAAALEILDDRSAPETISGRALTQEPGAGSRQPTTAPFVVRALPGPQ